MRPEDAKIIADFLLGTLGYEVSLTTSVLGAVPPGRLDYRPDPVSKTALGLLRHLALEDEWLLNAVADGRLGSPPDDSDACGVMTPKDAVERYQARVPAAIDRIKALSPERLASEVDFFGNKMPAVVVLSTMIRHTAHHRGQLSSYLRAMGGKVPSIYGPSADTVVPA